MAMNIKQELPSGWAVCVLPVFARIVMGQSPPSDTYNQKGVGLPFFQGKAEFGEIFPNPDKYCSVPNKIAEPGATLLSVRAPVGPTNLAKERCCIGRGLAAIHPLDKIDPKFILLLFRSIESNISGEGTGSTFKAITKAFVEGLEFGLPPLNEQVRIVEKIEALFSELDKGIEALKTAREQLKVYRQAVLKHAFEGKLTAQWREENKDKLESPEQLLARIKQEREERYQEQLKEWESVVKKWIKNGRQGKKPTKPKKHKPLPKLKNEEMEVLPKLPEEWGYTRLAEIAYIGSGMSVSKSRKLLDPIEVPYLRVANVQRGALVWDEVKSMSIEKDILSELALEKWDVLFNEGGDRDKLGRGWIWEGQINPCITQNHVFRASPYMKNEFHSKFISHWGNTFGRDYFEKGGKQTTNLASINKTVLSMFPVPVPSLEEQAKIIEYIDDAMSVIDSLELEIEQGIAKSETLRQSILKKAFSGQLVPQDPNDEPASVLLERIREEKAAQSKNATRKKSSKKKAAKKKASKKKAGKKKGVRKKSARKKAA